VSDLNSSFALGYGTSNEKWRTESTECWLTSNLFGALHVGNSSAGGARRSRFSPVTGLVVM